MVAVATRAARPEPEPEPEIVPPAEVHPRPDVPATSSEAPPARGDAPQRRPLSTTRAPSRLWLSAGGGVSLGLLAATGGQVRGAFAWRGERVRVHAGVDHWVRRVFPVTAPPGAGANISLTGGRVGAAGLLPVGWGQIPLGAFVGMGTARGRATGVEPARTRTRPWPYFGVSTGLLVPVSARWSVTLELDGVVGPVRHAFTLDNGVLITQMGAIGGVATVGAEIRLGR